MANKNESNDYHGDVAIFKLAQENTYNRTKSSQYSRPVGTLATAANMRLIFNGDIKKVPLQDAKLIDPVEDSPDPNQ